MGAVDARQGLADVFGILVPLAVVGFQELHTSVAGKVESFTCWVFLTLSIGQLIQCGVEAEGGLFTHLIYQLIGRKDVGKDDALRLEVGFVIGVIEDIVARTAYSHFVDHPRANLFVE